MDNFDLILDNCLKEISSGASSLDECLARHPEHAAQLNPLLQTALKIERGRALQPSPAFKARTREELYAHMRAHPRRRVWTFSPVWRAAVSLAVLVIAFFVTGTAFAQSALPGESLYAWKLSSERAWRAVAPDKVAVDLSLADRRVGELTAIAADPARKAEALNGYVEVLTRLKSERDAQNSDRILPALKSHQEKLSKSGVSVPDLDNALLPSSSNPAPAPVTPTPMLTPELLPTLMPSLPPILPATLIPTVIPIPTLKP